jgi:hypothetical protein
MARIVIDVDPLPATEPPPHAAAAADLGREALASILGVARCPCCHAPLVVRMDCRGPYFQCLCTESAFGVRRP